MLGLAGWRRASSPQPAPHQTIRCLNEQPPRGVTAGREGEFHSAGNGKAGATPSFEVLVAPAEEKG
jgi:hypothetical protein